MPRTEARVDEEKLRKIHSEHTTVGCSLALAEWREKVIEAYAELTKVAREGKLITYGELGANKLKIPLELLYARVGWITAACTAYEYLGNRPLLSALAVNKMNGRPGKGFWGLAAVPAHLRIVVNIGDASLHKISANQEAFWKEEVARIYKQWQG